MTKPADKEEEPSILSCSGTPWDSVGMSPTSELECGTKVVSVDWEVPLLEKPSTSDLISSLVEDACCCELPWDSVDWIELDWDSATWEVTLLEKLSAWLVDLTLEVDDWYWELPWDLDEILPSWEDWIELDCDSKEVLSLEVDDCSCETPWDWDGTLEPSEVRKVTTVVSVVWEVTVVTTASDKEEAPSILSWSGTAWDSEATSPPWITGIGTIVVLVDSEVTVMVTPSVWEVVS